MTFMYDEAGVPDHRYAMLRCGMFVFYFVFYWFLICVILHLDVGRLLNFPLRLRENFTVAAMHVRLAKTYLLSCSFIKLKYFS